MIHSAHILSHLKTYFGYDSFRLNQEKIIYDILDKRDILAIMPTGGGKSLCFQLPALLLEGTAIVISPLIALMKDQVDALKANGIAADFYNSSQEQSRQNQVLEHLSQGKLKLLYLAPESLPLVQSYFQQIKVSLIAIDEAHCISSWGHDFRPAYTQLGTLKMIYPSAPILAFTATADYATQDDIISQLNIPHAEKHLASFDRKNLYLEVRPGTDRLPQILDFLASKPDQSGIIYCLSRKATETVAQKLKAKGYNAKAYHAGMPAEERTQVQEDFVNDRTPIIVATIAFGMGIDKSNVRWVIHYNLPKNIESYYQEIGRSGRDGLHAHTLLFYSFSDVIQLRQFLKGTSTEEFQLAKLERMQQFAEALSCRRIALLGYFGEYITENCGNCDICKMPPEYFDGTLLAQKVCSAVARLNETEALGMVVDVLRGAKNSNVYNKGYDRIKTYGQAKDTPWHDLQQYIIQMINQGILEIRFHENGRLLLTPLAKKILFEGKQVKLAKVKAPEEITADDTAKKEAYIKAKSLGLFDKLRQLRQQIALEESVPAYIVFSDAALKDMEKILPKNEVEFLQVSGVGTAKKEKYGERFLALISTYLEQDKPAKKVAKITTQEQSYLLLEEGMTVADVAIARNLKEDTIYVHLMKLHHEGKEIDLSSFISPEEIDAIQQTKLKLPNEETLKAFFELLEEKIPYWKIRLGLYLANQDAGL
ncbi:MAG TPA: DNA helicase RecQ [Flavobacterium sp.]|nr:DNA helicase RecQ [Flavobacterium sp.]